MEILENLGIFAIISGLITFLIQRFIGKYFDKKTDLYKAELEKDIQEYKSKLDIHLTKASSFHEKRLEAISEIYKRVAILRITLADLTSSFSMRLKDPQKDAELRERRKKDAGNTYEDFLEYYTAKRIFIPKDTCIKLDEMKDQAWSVLFDYHWRENEYGDEYPKESREMIKEINERMRTKIPAILTELEDDFRESVDVEKK